MFTFRPSKLVIPFIVTALLLLQSCSAYKNDPEFTKTVSDKFIDTAQSLDYKIWHKKTLKENEEVVILGKFVTKSGEPNGPALVKITFDGKFNIIDNQYIAIDLLKNNHFINLVNYGQEIADAIQKY